MSDHVSRETPPVPSVAAGVFPRGLATAEAYVALLADAGVERGLIGPREVPRLWERHVLNSAVVEAGIAEGARLVDVGSGAGLPGIPLAIARPDLEITLLEPLERRVRFLLEVVDALGLDHVIVERGRAESGGAASYDVVTSRAVAPLEKLARWCLPLVAPGGSMMALKGRSAEEEMAGSERAIHKLGGQSVLIEEYGADLLAMPTRVVRVRVGGRRGQRPSARRP